MSCNLPEKNPDDRTFWTPKLTTPYWEDEPAYLLQENGEPILQENGGEIILE